MSLYPRQYHLDELTAHVVSLLERRRAGVELWDDAVEQALLDEAKRALDEAGRQFKEVADDPAYWQRTSEQLLTVAMPRYLKLAKAEHELEQRGYDVWRRGDLLSRVAYALTGLAGGALVLRTALPDWLEPLPLALFVLGPLLPEGQVWLAKRRYRKQLVRLVDDMKAEAEERRAYQPLGVDAGASGDAAPARQAEGEKQR